MTATTAQPELLRALRSLRVPRLLVATVEFAYRYLFVVGDEGSRMLRARASRSAAVQAAARVAGCAGAPRVAGHLVGTLFLRSLERSERVHAAMQARGYDGEPRFLAAPQARAGVVAVAAAVVLFGYLVQVAVRL